MGVGSKEKGWDVSLELVESLDRAARQCLGVGEVCLFTHVCVHINVCMYMETTDW